MQSLGGVCRLSWTFVPPLASAVRVCQSCCQHTYSVQRVRFRKSCYSLQFNHNCALVEPLIPLDDDNGLVPGQTACTPHCVFVALQSESALLHTDNPTCTMLLPDLHAAHDCATGSKEEMEAEVARLGKLLADMHSLDSSVQVVPCPIVDPSGAALGKLHKWRTERKAAIAAEHTRLTYLMRREDTPADSSAAVTEF